ncbi:hypothetical protein [Streptomyces sp. B21-083]|uniref:hypothetical protein n=1 Tax=Streptomyces sp. B21-083 TaxID=3039410 RepID=UPI002FEEAB7E
MTAPATAPDPGTASTSLPGALSQLIQEAIDRGDSYGKMAARAIDPATGTTVSKAYLNDIVIKPPTNSPSPERLGAIAAALGKPLQRVKEAAAKQWLLYEAKELAGYNEEVRIIVGHLAGKSQGEARRWRLMMEADDRAQREDDDG